MYDQSFKNIYIQLHVFSITLSKGTTLLLLFYLLPLSFNNVQNSYPKMSVKWSLAGSKKSLKVYSEAITRIRTDNTMV
jgi:hypothetical protein